MNAPSEPTIPSRVALFCANAYLAVFSLDAILAILDALAVGGSLADASWWRWPLLTVVLEAAVPLYVLLGLSPLLPKRSLIAPLLFLLWAWFGALPFSLTLEPSSAAVAIAGVQLCVAAMSLLAIRRRNSDGEWLVTAATTGRPGFSIAYTAKFFLAGLLVLPPLLSVMTVAYAGSVIVDSAGGFLSVARDGIYAEEREYSRADKTVYLVGMVHVADRAFYESVFGRFPSENAVILAEGVSDTTNRIQGDLSGRDELAARGGLTSQTDVALPVQAVVEVADIDAAALSKNSVDFINALIAALDSGDLREAAESMRPYFSPDRIEDAVAAVDELIALRNTHLLEQLSAALGEYDNVIVPWGAAHMPGIERGILGDGFALVARRSHRVIGFGASAGGPSAEARKGAMPADPQSLPPSPADG